MPLEPGSRLGPYVIKSALDAGGMREVSRKEGSREETRELAVPTLVSI